jgi:hypothetical protein
LWLLQLVDVETFASRAAYAPRAIFALAIALVVVAIPNHVNAGHPHVIGHRPDAGGDMTVDNIDLGPAELLVEEYRPEPDSG